MGGFTRYDQTILYDQEILVMYSMVSNGEGVAITMLHNADGTPRLYSPNE